MSDNSADDHKDYNMEIHNNFQNRGVTMNEDKLSEEFEKQWRATDGDNYPFDKKRLCFIIYESRQPEIDELKEQLSIKEDRIKSYNEVIGVRGEEIERLWQALEEIRIQHENKDISLVETLTRIRTIYEQAIKESK